MIKGNYKVSILVPIYGIEEYIERCVRSLFEQTYDNLEYVFVDDCSLDRSIEILNQVLKEYNNRKEQVKIIRHDKNRGLSAARKTAIKNATGDFVTHVDSDDWIDKDMIEKLVAKQKSTGADIISCNAITENGISRHPWNTLDIEDPRKMIMKYLSTNSGHQVWGRLIRKELYDDVVGPIEGLDNGEDTQIMPQLFYYSEKLANINEALYHYFVANPTSLTRMSGHNKVNIEPDISLIKSGIFVRDFFKDKDKELEEWANYYIALRIWTSLYRCACVDRDAFEKILSCKKHVKGNPFPSVAGKCGFVKTKLLMNYIGMSCLKKLRHFGKHTLPRLCPSLASKLQKSSINQ